MKVNKKKKKKKMETSYGELRFGQKQTEDKSKWKSN